MGILAVTEEECVDALASAVNDYEDAVIERTAMKADMDYIITRNVEDYQRAMIKTMLPDDFSALMEAEEQLTESRCIMNQWVNVTDTFSESQRHYRNTYLEICEVIDEALEVSLFSSEDGPYEIYFSFGIMYGIVYSKKENAYEKREQMKSDLEQEYRKNKEPSDEFIDSFAKKYDVCLPNDVLFDEGALMDAFMNIWDKWED